MPAAKHTPLAFVSVVLLAALALAGSAGSVRLQGKRDRVAPSVPTDIRVTAATATTLTLAWSPSTDNVGVAGYYVQVNAGRTRVAGPGYIASDLDCGDSVAVSVIAYDAAMNKSPSASATVSTVACPDSQPPSAPSGIQQDATTEDAVVLDWNDSTDNVGVVGYGVYFSELRLFTVPESAATLTGLSCGSTFEYELDAVDAAGNRSQRRSAWVQTASCPQAPPTDPPSDPLPPPPSTTDSPQDTVAPTEPANLSVASVTPTSVSLAWSPSTDNVGISSYRVYVNGVGTLNPTAPAATASGLACGTAFSFEVDAVDAAGNRSTRARVTASTSACVDGQAPSTPTNVTASSRTATSIALTWYASTDNVGVVGYGLYRGGTPVATSASTTGIVSGLTCNTNYTLSVDAFDAAGNMSAKATVLVATTACPDTTPPTTPTGLASSNITDSSVTLTWNPSTDNVGVAGYDVYRSGTKMASVTVTSSLQTGLSCSTSYGFGVEAVDAAGNRSARASINATTGQCPPPLPPPPSPPPPSPTEPPAIAGQGYSATFSDDFNSLDLGDQNTWSNGIWYSDPKPSPDMIFVRDGNLHLVSKQGVAPHYPSVTTLHHSGVGGRSFKFGYFEARMRWDNVQGAWPAFWLLSTLDRYGQNSASPSTSWCAELDIFEGYGDSYYGPTGFTGTLHKNTGSKWGIADETRGVGRATVADMTTGFHTYAALWTPTEVVWYFDGVELRRVPTFESTAQDMFLILGMQQMQNLPMGAAEMHLEVDYVKVWQKA